MWHYNVCTLEKYFLKQMSEINLNQTSKISKYDTVSTPQVLELNLLQ